MGLRADDGFAEWDEERYSTDIERFDEQHRRLFGLLNDLHAAMDEGHSNEEVGDILRELERYTEYHFGDEEEFMQDCGYAMDCADCFYDHREAHEEFAERVSELRRKHENGEYVTMEVLSFVRDWLDSHIGAPEVDQNYSEYFQTEVDDGYEYSPGTLYRRRGDRPDSDAPSERPADASRTVEVAGEVHDGGDLAVPADSMADWLASLASDRGERTAAVVFADGDRTERPFEAFYERARRVAGGLLATDLSPGDRLAVAAPSSYEWSVLDAACHLAGLVSVPLYPSFGDEQVRAVLDSAAVDGLATDGDAGDLASAVDVTVDIEHPPTADARALPGFDLDGDDVATVVFDPAGGAEPVGVALTHRNLLAATRSLEDGLPLDAGATGTCLLPLAHVYQRVATYYLWAAGGAVAYHDADSLATQLSATEPDVLVGVPKVYQRLYGELQDRIGELGWMKRKVAGKVTSYGRDVLDGNGTPLKYAAADRLVYGPLREAFGLSGLDYALCGTGRLDDHLIEFFRGVGVPLCELYGPIEATGIGALNWADSFLRDATGTPMAGVEVARSESGSVLLRGPAVMAGYLDDGAPSGLGLHDGWYDTGDAGSVDADGTLWLDE